MRSVVVAHGLWMPGIETGWLRRRLAGAGFTPHLFRFRTVRAGLDENAERMARFCAGLPGDELHYVGYSLGGVVAVTMLGLTRMQRPGRVVCLGSPLNGSRAAARMARSAAGRRVVGRSMLDLLERGGVGAWTGPCELGIVAGRVGVGIGRLLGVLPAPNDGTVAVDETRLDGATDHVVLPVTHTSMMFSARVAEAAIRFLDAGRFAAGDAPD